MVTSCASLSMGMFALKRSGINTKIGHERERVYRFLGGQWYDRTKIDPDKGERWFCSEAEAQAAGWRKSNQ